MFIIRDREIFGFYDLVLSGRRVRNRSFNICCEMNGYFWLKLI